MDTYKMQTKDTGTGARWCGTVALLALPVQVALGALMLGNASHAAQMLYAGVSSALLVVAGIACLRLRRRRAEGAAQLAEATRRLGRRDFARLPQLVTSAGGPEFSAVGQACLHAAAQLRRRFARLEAALEMDRWLLTVNVPEAMLRGALPLAAGILQSRSVSVALLDAADPARARCHDFLVEGGPLLEGPRELELDGQLLASACNEGGAIDLAAVGVDARAFFAPLADSGARAFRACPLRVGEHVIGFLCVGYRMEMHDQEDELFDAAAVAERLSIAFERIAGERALLGGLAPAPVRSPLESGLHRALRQDEFALAYQPIVRARSRELCAVEALVRWHESATGTERLAGEFIPVAEESGLIVDLGEWVLHAACAQYAEWRRQGVRLDYISVNVSAHQLRHSGLMASVVSTLHRHGMSPGELQLEFKESLLEEGAQVMALARELAQYGVRLALDDYGDGQSSLAALRELPVSALKIDRACIAGLDGNEQVRSLVRAVAGMGAATGKQVIAEGVERIEQLRFLEEAGCDALQGYLFAEPCEPTGIVDFSRRQQQVRILVA